MNYRLLLTKKQVMSINMLHYNHFFRICKVYDKIYEKFLLHFSMIFYKMMGEVMEYAFATIPFVFTKKRVDAF